MSSSSGQNQPPTSGYDENAPEYPMTQEELEEAKESYRADLQNRIGQLERDLSNRQYNKDGQNDQKHGKKKHISSSKSSKSSKSSSSRRKQSSSGSGMPTYPVSYPQSGYQTGDTGQSSYSGGAQHVAEDGTQWNWDPSQGWVPAGGNAS